MCPLWCHSRRFFKPFQGSLSFLSFPLVVPFWRDEGRLQSESLLQAAVEVGPVVDMKFKAVDCHVKPSLRLGVWGWDKTEMERACLCSGMLLFYLSSVRAMNYLCASLWWSCIIERKHRCKRQHQVVVVILLYTDRAVSVWGCTFSTSEIWESRPVSWSNKGMKGSVRVQVAWTSYNPSYTKGQSYLIDMSWLI